MYGVAYQLDTKSSESEAAKQRLDEREKRYEERTGVVFHASDGAVEPFQCLVYMAPLSGPLFLGEDAWPVMAAQVRTAAGPSGSNVDYVRRLAIFMKDEAGVEDDHLNRLEAMLSTQNE